MKRNANRALVLITLFLMGSGVLSSNAWSAQQCEEWVVRIESVQGTVEAQKPGETQWLPVELNDTYCPGTAIRTVERSRAAIVLRGDNVLRLHPNTVITFSFEENQRTSILDFLRGIAHFLSRTAGSLQVNTPYVNALVEGTEFLVKVEKGQTFISTFEGRVAVSNSAGSLIVAAGQSAVAVAGQPPVFKQVVQPRDAVKWALYYPLVLDFTEADFADPNSDWQKKVRMSMEHYWKGDLTGAFDSLSGIQEDIRDPRFFAYRAALLLTVGDVDEASQDLERVLELDHENVEALALQSVTAVVHNRKDDALRLAKRAVELDPASSSSKIALSYAQQAHFDIKGALQSVQEAVRIDPANALAQARLAELWLSSGYLDRALAAATRAVDLNPNLAHTQTVLGFAYLTQIKIDQSKEAFRKAIELDQAAPLPRLGLGLAKIRDGDLEDGRREIEIAVSLDPNNSLIRSYLGKAYFDEKRDQRASEQFTTAKELDPMDPTPWFYDAIRKQTTNRPVEALHDLQKSIELNDNRAVYRSRLLLDQDLGARSAALGRIYSDMGFGQAALVEGWKSLNTDPGNYSAHRLLADSYQSLPRHELARVSELLQSQLLQPINITPVQPHLAESNLFILEGSGPSDASFNEFNPLFNRNRLALQHSGVGGENSTLGDEVIQSGVWDRISYSLGQYHYETKGFRENNDLEINLYNAFFQTSVSPDTSIQAEIRKSQREVGDLELTFTGTFEPTLRQKEDIDTFRFGLQHSFTPRSKILGSFIYQNGDLEADVFPEPNRFFLSSSLDYYVAETRYLYDSERFNVTAGFGHRRVDETQSNIFPMFRSGGDLLTQHTNLYAYSQMKVLESLNLTFGASADLLEGDVNDKDRTQFNPKLGVTWNPFPNTTFRGAVFRTLQKPFVSQLSADPTLEPTQVAGFNQFILGPQGEDAWRYGIGVDQKVSSNLFAGAEVSARDINTVLNVGDQVSNPDWEERLGRVYLYWAPRPWLALSVEYLYEWFDREVAVIYTGVEDFKELRTHRVPLGIRYFHPSGFMVGLFPTFVHQEGDFAILNDDFTVSLVPGQDQFWVVDATVGYRLPKRYGLITLEAKNLFNQDFKFQDTDPANPHILPDSLVLLRYTLAF